MAALHSMAALLPPSGPIFHHPQYTLIDGDLIQRKAVPQPASRAEHIEEEESILAEVLRYVTSSMLGMGFMEMWVPDEDALAKCPIYATRDWEKKAKTLIVLINQVGGQAGLWSRSLCFSYGLKAGSMLECLARAIQEGFGVIVLNPNCNSVSLPPTPTPPLPPSPAAGSPPAPLAEGEKAAEAAEVASGGSARGRKVAIEDSRSPEEHTVGVWENLVKRVGYSGELYFLSYGNGASLAKDLLLKNLSADGGQETTPEVQAVEEVAQAPPEGSSGVRADAEADTVEAFGLTSLRIVACACIEASCLVESDDAHDLRSFVRNRFVNWEQSDTAPLGFRLLSAAPRPAVAAVTTPLASPLDKGSLVGLKAGEVEPASKLGCVSVSLGCMPEDQVRTSAWSVGQSLDGVFTFFEHMGQAEATKAGGGQGQGGGQALAFAMGQAVKLGLDPNTATVCTVTSGGGGGGDDGADTSAGPSASSSSSSSPTKQRASPGAAAAAAEPGGAGGGGGGLYGMFGRMFGMGSSGSGLTDHTFDSRMKVADFDLLKVVGKGAFGKVMLVRKKSPGADKGNMYAMKVLKKSMVIAKGQVEHTNSERSILREVRHPYIVCLRYAFQSEEKLYLITDYYAGGSLFYHLRKARGFSENRTRFYGAQLMLALAHLHAHHIIYRDLKLENVLMDHFGHIALTDFGLSKEGVEDVFEMQLSTFCGTAEYIAPELLKGQKYGAAVDWWSFGVLLYEMMGFKTPFFDKNRKLMFYNIINNEPQWQPHFSSAATALLKGLLMKPPTKRLGSGGSGSGGGSSQKGGAGPGPGGVGDIKGHAFFAPIDWAKLEAKQLTAPFIPEIKNLLDPKFVPKTYLNEQAHDSLDRNAKVSTNVEFDNFTYQPPSALDRDP